jgi:hypothetical protein
VIEARYGYLWLHSQRYINTLEVQQSTTMFDSKKAQKSLDRTPFALALADSFNYEISQRTSTRWLDSRHCSSLA